MSGTLFIQLGRFGDCLQSTPLLSAWRRRYPEDPITVLTHDPYRSVFEQNPNVDHVVVYAPPLSVLSDPATNPLDKLAAVRGWIRSLDRSYRSVVNLTHDSASAWLVAWLKPNEVHGTFVGDDGRIRIADLWGIYCLSLQRFRQQNQLNLVDAYAHISGGSSQSESLDFSLDEKDRVAVQSLVAPGGDHPWTIGFQPGAARPERRWPSERFIELGKYLRRQYGARIFVFGGRGEEELASRISHQISGAQSFAGRTSISELAALLTACRFLVTNDTGTMHLATAVGVQVVALYEASAYYRETGPYGEGHWIIQSRNISEYGSYGAESEPTAALRIPLEDVVFAVNSFISGSQREYLVSGPAQSAVDHYRSRFEDGHVGYVPVRKVHLSPETLCGYLQKPVWVGSLQGTALNCSEAASKAMKDLLHVVPSLPVVQWSQWIREFRCSVAQLELVSRSLKDRVTQLLARVEQDTRYQVPQDELGELTRMESVVLENKDSAATLPFVSYFETAVAMVGGNNTREYLIEYLGRVCLLAEQAGLFDRVLREVARILSQQDAKAEIQTVTSG